MLSATAPPWFAQALQQALNPINARFDAIEARFDGIEACFNAHFDIIETKVDKLTIFTVKVSVFSYIFLLIPMVLLCRTSITLWVMVGQCHLSLCLSQMESCLQQMIW